MVDTPAQEMLADYEAIAGAFLVAVAIPSMIGESWLASGLLLTKKLEN